MANIITITPNIKLASGNLSDQLSPGAIQITQNTTLLWKNVLSITTADTSLSALINNITTYGWAYFWNLDATNYVQLGPDNAGGIVPFVRLAINEAPAQFRIEPGITIRGKAHTATCKVLVAVYDD